MGIQIRTLPITPSCDIFEERFAPGIILQPLMLIERVGEAACCTGDRSSLLVIVELLVHEGQ